MSKKKYLIIGGCPRSGTGALAKLLTFDGRALITLEKGMNAWRGQIEGADKDRLVYIGDKMPENYLSNAQVLLKERPNARFLFTIRSGYGVMASYIRRAAKKWPANNLPSGNVKTWIKRSEAIWIKSASSILSLKHRLSKDKYLVLRYEDSVTDVDGLLRKLGEFLEYDSPVKNKVVPYKGQGISGPFYRSHHLDWTLGVERWLDEIIQDRSDQFKRLMVELGYSLL